jgi:predicted DNA-binding transcriptional regulator AlpA
MAKQVDHPMDTLTTSERDLPVNGAAPDRRLREMLNEEQLLQLLPFSRRTLYALMEKNLFPKGSFVSENRRIWFLDEIVGWQRSIEANNLRGQRVRRRSSRKAQPRQLSR